MTLTYGHYMNSNIRKCTFWHVHSKDSDQSAQIWTESLLDTFWIAKDAKFSSYKQ